MRGVFFSRIYIADSHRLNFRVYWEAGHDKVFLVTEPGLLKEKLVLTSNLKRAIVTL